MRSDKENERGFPYMHAYEKHPAVAFVLALFPGIGHFYLGKWLRGLFYFGTSAGTFGLLILFTIARGIDPTAFLLTAVIVGAVWAVNMLDMIFTLAARGQGAREAEHYWRQQAASGTGFPHGHGIGPGMPPARIRSTAMLLSIIPGAGHMYVGQPHRGQILLLSALAAAFGAPAMAIVLHQEIMMIGWLALPAIVAYAAVDAAGFADKLTQGEWAQDGSLWDGRSEEERNRTLAAAALSLIPGAGHLYLGRTAQGVRLLAAGLALMYLAAQTGWRLAACAVPFLCVWAVFDARRIAQTGESAGGLEGSTEGKWAGIALIAAGCIIFYDRFFPSLWPKTLLLNWAEPAIAAVLLVGFGIDLLRSRKAV